VHRLLILVTPDTLQLAQEDIKLLPQILAGQKPVTGIDGSHIQSTTPGIWGSTRDSSHSVGLPIALHDD
jgi:hypothetical protein